MLLSRSVGVAVGSSRPTLLLPHTAVIQRNCRCCAKRGRPAKTREDVVVDDTEPEPAPAKRKGRKRKTEVEPAPTAAEAPLTVQMQPLEEHEKVISIEDMTSSVELDYTDNAALIVPSYTHQAQGHESATQPPLDNYVPYSDSPGFVGSEELPQQSPAAAGTAAGASPAPTPAAAAFMQQEQQDMQELEQKMQQWQQLQQEQPAWQDLQQLGVQEQQQQQAGLGVQVAEQQQLVGPSVGSAGAAGDEEEDDDELLGYDDPPGLFDYEAGLAFAVVEQPPEQPMEHIPRQLRAKSRREADYMLRYISHLADAERQDREVAYKEKALEYHLAQVKESNNVYLTGKALSVVMAEIELEDAQTGNRTDSFYPIWARAEHRWYPSGRFAAYNQYVKENLPDLTVKYAPGADQEVDLDIMDDVLLMSDESLPGAGDAEDEEAGGNPAAGLSIDSFMGPGMLPGAGSSDLGAAYLEDVLAPEGDEELEEELME